MQSKRYLPQESSQKSRWIWNCKRLRVAKAILEKKYKVGELKFQISKLTTKQQRNSNQDSVMLAQGYTYRLMELNRESRSKNTGQWSTDFQQVYQDHSMRKE